MPPLHGTPPEPMTPLSEQGRENFDKIFRKKERKFSDLDGDMFLDCKLIVRLEYKDERIWEYTGLLNYVQPGVHRRNGGISTRTTEFGAKIFFKDGQPCSGGLFAEIHE